MKSSIFYSIFAAGTLIISTAAAQTSPPSQPAQPSQTPPQTMRSHRRPMGGPMVARLTRQLNLTPDQQNHARSIFADARKQAQSLAPKLRGERQAMSAAIKSDNEAQIDQIARQDRTDARGRTGKYDITLQLPRPDGAAGPMPPPSTDASANTSSESSSPAFFTVIEEQLGLKLHAAKGLGKTLIIDHIEKPSEN